MHVPPNKPANGQAKHPEAAPNNGKHKQPPVKPSKSPLQLLTELRKAEKKPNHFRAAGPKAPLVKYRQRGWLLSPSQRADCLRMWEDLGADPAAMQIIKDKLPEVLTALFESASVPGSIGFSDRAVVLRMLGLQHLLPGASGGGDKGETDRRIAALGDRLAGALAARQAAIGQGSVTRAPAAQPKPVQDVQFEEVTHKMADLVREDEMPITAPAPPAPPAPAQPAQPAQPEPARLDALADLHWG